MTTESDTCMYPRCNRPGQSKSTTEMDTYTLRLVLCAKHRVLDNRHKLAFRRWLHAEMDRQERAQTRH